MVVTIARRSQSRRERLPERAQVSLAREWIEHDKGYRDRFRSWSDGGDEAHVVSVSRTEDTILKLTVDVERRLEARASTDWKGSVLTTPPAEDGFYPDGTEVRVRAVAIPPAKFVGWNGDVAGRDPTTPVVMDDGKRAEAVFVREAAELESSAATPVSLQWRGDDIDWAGYYVRTPPDGSRLEVRFDTESATPGAEAGLWVTDREMFPNWVRHQDAHRVLRDGVATLGVGRPPDRRPTAWFIMIRAAESDDAGTQTFEGTLVATFTRDGNPNRAPQPVGALDDCQQPSRTDEFFDARRCWPGHRSLRVDLDEDEDLGCGRYGKPRSSRFSELPVGALFASMGSVGVHGPGAGGRHGVRVAYERTQTWGEGPVPPTGTLVTVSGSDRPSRSLLLCHGSGSLSSRRPPRALRRRGPAPPTESLSSLQPSLRRLRGVRPRPCLLHTIVSDGSSSPVGSSRQGPPSMQS